MRESTLRTLGRLAVRCALVTSPVARAGGENPPPPPQIASGSIVYIKRGDVWLSDPSGTTKRRVTTDGRYRSPSMADDGTIGVLRDPEQGGSLGTEFVRLTPAGATLGKFTWPSAYPLRQAALSPDGRTFAHVYSGLCAYVDRRGTRQCWRLAFTPTDRYEEVEVTGRFQRMDYEAIAWLSNQRLLVTGGANFFAVEVYVRGQGVDANSPDGFVSDDYKIFRAALMPDGQKIVTYQRRFLGFNNGEEVLGPHEVAIWRRVGPKRYEPATAAQRTGPASAPTVSPDGKAWAFSDDGGIWLNVFGASELRSVDPDGREPRWGPYVVK